MSSTASAEGRTSANRVLQVTFTDATIVVRLTDGCILTVPLFWFPRLQQATVATCNNWRLADNGCGIRWPELDLEFSVNALLKPDTYEASLRRQGPVLEEGD